MKFENTAVWGFEHAIRGMRNPYQSWNRSDSTFDKNGVFIGESDLTLMQSLIRGGSEHRKFMRQIFVSVDITAPNYWLNEFATYKIGTTSNSTSLQHTGSKRDFVVDDFEYKKSTEKALAEHLKTVNSLREKYLLSKNYEYFEMMRELIPMGYLYTITWTGSYENLYTIYHQRKNHKLTNWKCFIEWIETLPYAKELILFE